MLEVGDIAVPSVEMFAKSVVAYTNTVTNVSDNADRCTSLTNALLVLLVVGDGTVLLEEVFAAVDILVVSVVVVAFGERVASVKMLG